MPREVDEGKHIMLKKHMAGAKKREREGKNWKAAVGDEACPKTVKEVPRGTGRKNGEGLYQSQRK